MPRTEQQERTPVAQRQRARAFGREEARNASRADLEDVSLVVVCVEIRAEASVPVREPCERETHRGRRALEQLLVVGLRDHEREITAALGKHRFERGFVSGQRFARGRRRGQPLLDRVRWICARIVEDHRSSRPQPGIGV